MAAITTQDRLILLHSRTTKYKIILLPHVIESKSPFTNRNYTHFIWIHTQ